MKQFGHYPTIVPIMDAEEIIVREEDFQAEDPVVEELDDSSMVAINQPFDPTKIKVTVQNIAIFNLIRRLENERINMKTKFQRQAGLWKDQEMSRLIESLLVRIPLPAFYFDGSDDNSWEVVDGLQRLSTLKRFIITKDLKLRGLEYLKEFEGFGFEDLPAYLQGRIEETNIIAYLIQPGTPEQVKFNIFKRINTGGLVLTAQEIRHALNQGIPADFVEDLAKLDEFKHAMDGAVRSDRMEDRDFTTRFLGFYTLYDEYQPDLDSFLNKAMAGLKKMSLDERNEIRVAFRAAMKAARGIFYNDAFRKRYAKGQRRRPLNKALFDAWSVNLAKLSDGERAGLVQRRERVIAKQMQLMNKDDEFFQSISSSTGDPNRVRTRHQRIRQLILEVLGNAD